MLPRAFSAALVLVGAVLVAFALSAIPGAMDDGDSFGTALRGVIAPLLVGLVPLAIGLGLMAARRMKPEQGETETHEES